MWLVARPLGGLNDILCTIHRCYLYCAQYNRKLVIHTAHISDLTLFADGIERYFNSKEIALGITEKDEYFDYVNKYLDLELHHYPWRVDPINLNQSTSLTRGWHQPVVFYSGYGGGTLASSSFKYLSITPEIKSYLSAKLELLPTGYVAVHCRYTDYQSDLDHLWEIMDSISTEIDIYFATDSSSVLCKANERYPNRIINYTRRLSSAITPIHHSELALAEETIYDMFLDLAVLCFAERIYCTRLKNPSIESIPLSGFCILAQSLSKLQKRQLIDIFT